MFFFNEWRAAARAAATAERVVSEAFMLYFNGKGAAPSTQQVADAKRRREVADDLFALALKNWKSSSDRPGPLDD
jgi:hypothetical protein